MPGRCTATCPKASTSTSARSWRSSGPPSAPRACAGLDFDQRTLEALKEGHWSGLAKYDERTLERIQPEGRRRHLGVLRGFLGEDVKGVVHCYGAGTGVGAALIEFPVPGSAAPVTRPADAAAPGSADATAPPAHDQDAPPPAD